MDLHHLMEKLFQGKPGLTIPSMEKYHGHSSPVRITNGQDIMLILKPVVRYAIVKKFAIFFALCRYSIDKTVQLHY